MRRVIQVAYIHDKQYFIKFIAGFVPHLYQLHLERLQKVKANKPASQASRFKPNFAS